MQPHSFLLRSTSSSAAVPRCKGIYILSRPEMLVLVLIVLTDHSDLSLTQTAAAGAHSIFFLRSLSFT